MEPESIQVISLIVLLFLSAFFSSSETALMALSRLRIRNMANEGVKGAKILDKMLDNPTKILSTILVGNNLVNIAASAIATSLAIKQFGSNGIGIATGLMTLIVLIFGEVTPKSLATNNAEAVALKVAGPLNILSKIFTPITAILMFLTRAFVKFLGGDPDEDKPFVTEEDLRTMVEVGHEEGLLLSEERNIIDNVFEFRESQVKDVMTTRTDMVAVEEDIQYHELISIFKEEQYSRLPVYEGTSDNIIGVIYVKDLVFQEIDEEDFDVKKYMREPFFTYEFQRISRLFEQLRHRRIALAIVLDEYGGTAGIATLEDLVEEIVGDLEDEYDTVDKQITILNAHEFVTEGTVKIDFLNDQLHLNINDEEYDTIGGYVFGAFGRIPQIGESIVSENKKFTVQALDKHRIERIKIDIRPKVDEA
ncbi:MAG: hemolysin family protein [Tissierellia bacterium]|nr:hemolysin family protein [Tissierellia bacterium]